MKIEIISPDNKSKLRVFDCDFGPFNYQDALNACAALGSGWRIPSEEELFIIYEHIQKNYPNDIKKFNYWTCSIKKVEDERISELIRSGIYRSGPRGISPWKNYRVILNFANGSFGDVRDCDSCFVLAVHDIDNSDKL